MAVDERSLHDLYTHLEDWIGAQSADTLMSMLPPADWNWHDVATKQDLGLVRDDLERQISGLRTELKGDINNLRTELKGDINSLRNDMNGESRSVLCEIESLRSDMNGEFRNVRSEMESLRYQLMSHIDNGLRETTRTILLAQVGSILTLTTVFAGAIAWVAG